MKKFLLLVLVILILSSSLFAMGNKENSNDNSLEKIKNKKSFILGLDDAFPPMGFRDENNDIVGFDIDVAKEVCKDLNVVLVLQPINWDAKEQELATENIDCIWNGFTVTKEREKKLSFSHPYLKNSQAIVVKNKKYKNLKDLYGKNIGLQAGSSASLALDNNKEFKSNVNIVEFKDNLTALMDLNINGVDAVIMDLIVAKYAIKKSNLDFFVLDESLSSENYAIGFRKNDIALKNEVNKILLNMKKDGRLAKISKKWFKNDITIIKDK